MCTSSRPLLRRGGSGNGLTPRSSRRQPRPARPISKLPPLGSLPGCLKPHFLRPRLMAQGLGLTVPDPRPVGPGGPGRTLSACGRVCWARLAWGWPWTEQGAEPRPLRVTAAPLPGPWQGRPEAHPPTAPEEVHTPPALSTAGRAGSGHRRGASSRGPGRPCPSAQHRVTRRALRLLSPGGVGFWGSRQSSYFRGSLAFSKVHGVAEPSGTHSRPWEGQPSGPWVSAGWGSGRRSLHFPPSGEATGRRSCPPLATPQGAGVLDTPPGPALPPTPAAPAALGSGSSPVK